MTKEEAFKLAIEFIRNEVLVDGISKEDKSKAFMKFIDGEYNQEANEIVWDNSDEFSSKYEKEFSIMQNELSYLLFKLSEDEDVNQSSAE